MAQELEFSVIRLWGFAKKEKDSEKTWMNVVVRFIGRGKFKLARNRQAREVYLLPIFT